MIVIYLPVQCRMRIHGEVTRDGLAEIDVLGSAA